MASLSDLVPLVAPDAPGASEAAILQACSYSAREFCKRVGSWRNELTPISVEAAVSDYDLFPELEDDEDDNVEILRLAKVVLDDQELVEGDDYRYSGGVLHLNEAPTNSGTDNLEVTLVLRPVYGGSYMDDTVFEDNRETLAYGALSRLLVQPKKPWSDPDRAAIYGQQFAKEAAEARWKFDTGSGAGDAYTPDTRNATMIRMRSF